MKLTLRTGSRYQTIRFLLVDEQESGGKIGLTPLSEGLTVAYLREGELSPKRIELRTWREATHVPGGFREIDAALMPGLYELGLPDEVCQEGANSAVLMVQAPETGPRMIHIDLFAYDPFDGYRLGLECLSREGRHEVISRAFREVVPEIIEEFRRGALSDGA